MRRQESGFVTLNALALTVMLGLAIMSLLQQDCCNPPCPVTPTIQVVTPNGGNAWGIGTTVTIQWLSGNVSGNVRIELSRDWGNDGTWETIADNVSNTNGVTNSTTWLVNDPPSSTCLIKITATDGTIDTSDQAFTIGYAPPSLALTAPVGGDILEFGTVQYIRWSSVLVNNVKIELSRDGGASYNTLVASVPSAPSSYPWTVTDPFTSQARIRISAVENPSVYATSLVSFTIQPSLKITSTVFSLSSTTLSTQTLGPTQTATLGDTIELTTTVTYGAGFQPGWQITVQATFTKSDNRINYTLARDRQTLPIPTTSAGTLTFTFPLTVGTDSYGGKITGSVFSPNTTTAASPNLICLTCEASCSLLTAKITDFKFIPSDTDPGTRTVTLRMEVTWWARTSGSIRVIVGKQTSSGCDITSLSPSPSQYIPFSETMGLSASVDWNVTVTNTCEADSVLTYAGSIVDEPGILPFKPDLAERVAPLALRSPKIGGPTNLWWFDGQTPSAYATQITLTASPTNAGSYQWAVATGTDKVNFSNGLDNITTGTNQVTLVSTGKSTFHEVGIRVTVNGATSTTFGISVRAPDHIILVENFIHQSDPVFGYKTTIHYRIEDQFTDLLPSIVPVNENWTTPVVEDFSQMNWRRDNPNGDLFSPGFLPDMIEGEDIGSSIPTPTAPCSPQLCNTAVYHWGAEIRVGSPTPGIGRRVQTYVLQKYTDHASHQNRVSPAP